MLSFWRERKEEKHKHHMCGMQACRPTGRHAKEDPSEHEGHCKQYTTNQSTETYVESIRIVV